MKCECLYRIKLDPTLLNEFYVLILEKKLDPTLFYKDIHTSIMWKNKKFCILSFKIAEFGAGNTKNSWVTAFKSTPRVQTYTVVHRGVMKTINAMNQLS